MATQNALSLGLRIHSGAPIPVSDLVRCILALLFLLFCSISTHAQFQSAVVFAPDPKGVAVYTRNDVTGILTPVTGSPFPGKQPVNVMTLDFAGRFLFTASNTGSTPGSISMFTVDPNTGLVQEVPKSPFASPATNAPVFLSTESSGQFLYVINFSGSSPGASSIESFQIDAVNLDLIPSTSGAVQLPGLFLSGGTHLSGKSFYAFLNNPGAPILNEAIFLLFDSATGKFTNPNPNLGSSAGTFGCCFALDPQGKSLALGIGGQFTLYSLQADGTLGPNPGTNSLSGRAVSMSFDTFGRFVYVDFAQPPTTSTIVHFFSATSLLESVNSPLPSNFPSTATWIVDPTAPLIYADQVYQVDPQTGIPGSILPSTSISKPAFFSRPPGSQPILGPIAQLSSTSLSFGSLTAGQTSSAQALAITSAGGQALSLNTLGMTGANSGDFTETDTCHVPTALQVGSSCSVLISFAPLATGVRSAALTITDNASPSTQSASLSGTGLAPSPAVTLIPGSLDFGAVTQGTSTPLNISVKNSGTGALHITSVAVGGPNANDYSSSNPTCNAAIAVNSSCTVTVIFTPLAPGVRSAAVTITDDASPPTQSVSLTGTGTSAVPAVTFSPAVPSFPATTQGTSSVAQTLTVTNTGNATLHVSSVSRGGPHASEFGFTNNCTAPVSPTANCTILLVFSPIAPGQRSASLVISDDVPGSPQTLVLNGTGVAAVPAVTFSPTVPSFPTTTQGTSSAPQTLTVISTGTAPLHVSSVSLGGPNPSDFSFTNNCTAPIAPAANCTILLVFSPIGPGQRTANLIISDDVSGSPQTISLSATANPAVSGGAAPGGSTSASVSAGQTAQFQLQLTPGPGFTGTVSLTCTGAPLGAVCHFPNIVTLANGAAAPFTVTVSTSGSAIFPPAMPRRFVPPGQLPILFLLVMALVFLGTIKLGGKFAAASRGKRLAWNGVLAAVFVCAVIYVARCGATGASVATVPPPIITPAGTSTIAVSPTAMSSTGQPLQLQPIQLTLTVN